MGKTLGVVPVRMESSRFPGKPLQLILMVSEVWGYTEHRDMGVNIEKNNT